MANKSNTTNQTISLPQGGGALQGIGETFSPDLHTDTGNFTVSIALPLVAMDSSLKSTSSTALAMAMAMIPLGWAGASAFLVLAVRPRKAFPATWMSVIPSSFPGRRIWCL